MAQAYQAAVRDGYFDLVVIDYGSSVDLEQSLVGILNSGGRYRRPGRKMPTAKREPRGRREPAIARRWQHDR